MTEIQPHTTACQDEYPYWVPDGVAVEIDGHRLRIDFVEGNHVGESGIPSMTGRQRKMRRAINRGWVDVRLCHLILHSDGSYEWEITEF